MNKILHALSITVLIAAISLLPGCQSSSGKKNTFIIWTDREELVSYTELFNSLQDKPKAIVVYKERLANALPPAKDEAKPDLVIGSWLKNSRTRRLFRPLDSILSKDSVDTSAIYASLLEYGKTAGKQYLLPVSFNLPLVIYSTKNENKLPDKYFLSLDQIRDTAGDFNSVNKDGFYTNMGFAPSWDREFIYETTKQFGRCFTEKGTAFEWDADKLSQAVEYVRSWTLAKNKDTAAEQDFQFKYLYTPKYRQIASERTLFAYTTSNELFSIPFEQLGETGYRWLTINGSLLANDDIVSMAVYTGAKNPEHASEFIRWFFQEENQKAMLERNSAMSLDTATFGIASGFSSIASVNEKVFPSYYHILLGNLPVQDNLVAPQGFPARWQSLKERVIYPYLAAATNTDSTKKGESMETLLNSWLKQFE